MSSDEGAHCSAQVRASDLNSELSGKRPAESNKGETWPITACWAVDHCDSHVGVHAARGRKPAQPCGGRWHLLAQVRVRRGLESAIVARSATRLTRRSGNLWLRKSSLPGTVRSGSIVHPCIPAPNDNRDGPLRPPSNLRPVHDQHCLNLGKHRAAVGERELQVAKAPILPLHQGDDRRFNDRSVRWRELQAPPMMSRSATPIDGKWSPAHPKRPVATAQPSNVGLTHCHCSSGFSRTEA